MEKHPNPKVAYTAAVILVLALAAGAYGLTRLPQPASDTPLVTSQATATPDVTADWTTLSSKIVNLKFKYPSTTSYQETEPLTDQTERHIVMTGHQPYFGDNKNVFPSFDATSSDFTAQDSIAHDLVSGTLDSASSFTVSVFDASTTVTTEVAPGMFQVSGYGNIECGPYINSFLIVRPPANSGLKYIIFYLDSTDPGFTEQEIVTDCAPSAATIASHVAAVQADATVKTNLANAISIAKTFTTK